MTETEECRVAAAVLSASKRDARRLRAALRSLTNGVSIFLAKLDAEMKEPSTVEQVKEKRR